MITDVHIVANGIRTPLGLQTASSAAGYRAGISAVAEHPFMVDQQGDPMPGALDSELDPALVGAQRFLALAETALQEVAIALGDAPNLPLQLPMFLGLPEHRPGFTREDAEVIRAGLMRTAGLPMQISELHIAMEGHAAGLAAFATASRRIQQGALDACVVGGVDSYFHPDTMEWLDGNRQLPGATSRSAFVPGEAAGFSLLMSERLCERLGTASLARLAGVATGREQMLIKTQDICLGAGLTTVVQNAVDGFTLPAETINMVICDINGERYRSEEWGFVCLRLAQYFDDPTAFLSPADCWGDVGAASGALFAALACEAAARGYASGPRAMLWASSENGLRSAVTLHSSVSTARWAS